MDQLGGFNPQDLQKYLQGVNWPADKEQVANTAEGNGAPQGLLEQIRNLGAASSTAPRT